MDQKNKRKFVKTFLELVVKIKPDFLMVDALI